MEMFPVHLFKRGIIAVLFCEIIFSLDKTASKIVAAVFPDKSCRLSVTLHQKLSYYFPLDFFHGNMAHIAPLDHVHHVLGHVLGVIPDALDRFRDKQDFYCE